MGESKGKATATVRIVILSDIYPLETLENNIRLNGKSVLTYEMIKESTKYVIGDSIKL